MQDYNTIIGAIQMRLIFNAKKFHFQIFSITTIVFMPQTVE